MDCGTGAGRQAGLEEEDQDDGHDPDGDDGRQQAAYYPRCKAKDKPGDDPGDDDQENEAGERKEEV
jgi:hypothetical protein